MTTQTLANALWPAKSNSKLIRNIFLAVTGTIALWISAKIQVPFFPVPMTMQTLVVLAIGAGFGWRLGMATILLYLAEGALGLPVFSGTPERGIGLAYMAGPTGGYLAGFVVAAGFVGWLAEKGADRNVITMFMAMLAGSALIYASGAAWLSGFIGFEKSLAVGVFPFVLGDVTKAALAAVTFPAIWYFTNRK